MNSTMLIMYVFLIITIIIIMSYIFKCDLLRDECDCDECNESIDTAVDTEILIVSSR